MYVKNNKIILFGILILLGGLLGYLAAVFLGNEPEWMRNIFRGTVIVIGVLVFILLRKHRKSN